jgi:hypothetical protein
MAVFELSRVFCVDADVLIADDVPRGAVVLGHPHPRVVIDRQLLGATDAARRFLLGWAFDAIRGGYALLLSLGHRQRIDLGTLLNSFLLVPGERPGATETMLATLPTSARAVVDRHAGSPPADPEHWMDGMVAIARRAGLVACDDFAASTWMLARLGGETLGVAEKDIAALGPVLAGEDLIRFYLSDEYNELRRRLTRLAPDASVSGD